MKTIPAILLLGLAACADPGNGQTGSANGAMAILIRDLPGEAADCALQIRFGSYAMGFDRATAQRIEALVAADPGVRAAARHRWGREGEYTLCVDAAPAEAQALLGRIRPLLPAAPRGPIAIVLRDGTRVDAPPR